VKSDIPPNVVEEVTREFRREGGAIYHRITKAAKNDLALPSFRQQDNSPRRRFPSEIEQLFR